LVKYLLGKDLIYKGHTLECWNNEIPKDIVYKATKPESLEFEINDNNKISSHIWIQPRENGLKVGKINRVL